MNRSVAGPAGPAATIAAWLGAGITLRVLSFVIVFAAWEYAGRVPVALSFPTFLATMQALGEMLLDLTLIKAFAVTLQPLLLGLAISIVIGVGCGVAMGLSRAAEWFASPVFIVAQTAPVAALIPVLVFAYGIGLTSKVLTVCILAMPTITLNTLNAVRHTPRSLIEMGTSFLGNRRQLITKIILPAAAPMIFAGLRLGCAGGFIGVILAELLITPTGIGDIITYSQSIAEYERMYAAIFAVIAASVLFIELLERIEITLFRPEKRIAR